LLQVFDNSCHISQIKPYHQQAKTSFNNTHSNTLIDFFADNQSVATGTMLSNGYFPSISTIQQCTDKCYSTSGCYFFSYDCSQLQCYLKSALGDLVSNVNYMSGDINCT
jgi:hypothetical protein